MLCENCSYFWKNGQDLYPSCHFDAENRFGGELAPCEEVAAPLPRYVVSYEGMLFEEDGQGLNIHRYNRWDDAISVYNAYPEIVTIEDTETGMSFARGEWF